MIGNLFKSSKRSTDAAPAPPDPEAYCPASGYTEGGMHIPAVDHLSDEELRELNGLLPWNCFVVDANGRRFGKPTSPTKRMEPQVVPDRRIVQLHERFGLGDKTVLEVGCFEGIHTVALCRYAAAVKGCDARVSNVVKTAVRCAMFQVHPTVFVWDVEKAPPPGIDASCDVLHHCGVLYHLHDPAAHLRNLAPLVRYGMMLDTHVAEADQVTEDYNIGDRFLRCKLYGEHGMKDPFSGVYATSRWLLLDDLVQLLKESGFTNVDVAEKRAERNGSRVLIYARRG